jgi:hypothetical protein
MRPAAYGFPRITALGSLVNRSLYPLGCQNSRDALSCVTLTFLVIINEGYKLGVGKVADDQVDTELLEVCRVVG